MAIGVIEDAVLRKRLTSDLPGWSLHPEESVIFRCYETNGWKSSLMIANAIGYLSEAAWHHPELVVAYSSVCVYLTTHSESGVTELDFALAAKIDNLIKLPPAEGVLKCAPAKYAMLKPDKI